MNKSTIRLLIVFLIVLVGSGLLVYLVLDRSSRRAANVATETPAAVSPAATPTDRSNSILSELFDPDYDTAAGNSEDIIASRIFLRFLIAAILATFLAFRWRRGLSLSKRNPYVAQTQILLAVVAAAMMMVVGDSAARAFGIFAAASLVRFRTNIRDPKETTVLLICLGVGLACGVGRLDMAAILTVFSLVMLWVLENFERGQVFKTMNLSVGTRNLDQTLKVLKDIFARNRLSAELRQLERQTEEGELHAIVYQLSMGASISTDELTEQILAEESENIASLEWEQKKSMTYIYS